MKNNKDTKKTKEEPLKVKDGLQDLSAKMDAVVSGLNTVSDALVKLVDVQTAANKQLVPGKIDKVEPKKEFNPKLDDETYPQEYIPPVFRKLVDDILSEEFEIHINDFEDRTDFHFHVVVPEEYSSLSKEDKEKGMKDIRSRMIPRALGENGVRGWCELIRTNLNRFYTKKGIKSPFIN